QAIPQGVCVGDRCASDLEHSSSAAYVAGFAHLVAHVSESTVTAIHRSPSIPVSPGSSFLTQIAAREYLDN
ncbi:MAG TPA: hypothetical protein VEZ51_12040, partial [Gemmatimonadaceae bacterium]|nr:hypothetical protein [Gemmatimonadaceae bacterium]